MTEPARAAESEQAAPAAPASTARQPPTVARALALQRTAGNRAVGRLLARTPVAVRGTTRQPRTGSLGAFEGPVRFDVDFSGEEAIATVKIKLVPDHDVTTAEANAVKVRAEATFLALWDERFIITDDARHERYFLRTRVQWVSSGQHVRVRLRSGDHDIDQTNWSVGDQSIEFAHEISHTLGLLDEYVDPTVVARRTATSPGVFHDHSLMGNYFTEGIPQAEVKLRSGQTVADFIGRAMRPRRHFVASFTGPAQGQRLVNWRAIRDSLAAGSAERAEAAAEVQAIETDMMIPQLSAAAGVPYTPVP
jgi:hypothetical protein